MFCYIKLCSSCNNYNKYCTCLLETYRDEEKTTEQRPLDKSLNEINMQEYEEVIELWKTYGGD